MRQAWPGVRRVVTWAGELRGGAAPDQDSCWAPPTDRRRGLRRAASSAANLLPPLAPLPPPISLGAPAPLNIDMNVDFDAEIRPHLRTCLARLVFSSLFCFGWRPLWPWLWDM
jgi:hypothetical protein